MREEIKQSILDNINNQPVTDIESYLRNGSISLNEMFQAKINQTHLGQIATSIYVELIKNKSITLSELQHKINPTKYDEIKRIFDIGDAKTKLLDDLKQDKLNTDTLKKNLQQGVLSKEEIFSNTPFTNLDLERILSSIRITPPYHEWKDIPDLLPERTDIYLLGQPGSGKSCILASLLCYSEDIGKLSIVTHNRLGTQYKDLITGEYRNHFLPKKTPLDGVNYITVDITDKSNNVHPLNFIEMGGELFNDTYETGKLDSQSINARNYLRNTNYKKIFFILDYDRISNESIPSQSNKFMSIISMLEHEQIINSDLCLSINIIINKSDLYPTGIDKDEYTEKVLQNHFAAFYNMCRNINIRLKIDLFYMDYSLGRVVCKDYLLEKNLEYPDAMLFDLILGDGIIRGPKKKWW